MAAVAALCIIAGRGSELYNQLFIDGGPGVCVRVPASIYLTAPAVLPVYIYLSVLLQGPLTRMSDHRFLYRRLNQMLHLRVAIDRHESQKIKMFSSLMKCDDEPIKLSNNKSFIFSLITGVSYHQREPYKSHRIPLHISLDHWCTLFTYDYKVQSFYFIRLSSYIFISAQILVNNCCYNLYCCYLFHGCSGIVYGYYSLLFCCTVL